MQSRGSVVGVVLLAAVSLFDCAGGGTTPEGPTVAAEVGGETISNDELLQQLVEDQWELVSSTLDRMVAEKLMEKEAAAREIDVEELVRAEIGDKIEPPTPEEIQGFYAARQASMGGRTLEQVASQIEMFLQQQRFALRRDEWVSELKKANGFRAYIDPPRVTLDLPEGTPSRGPADAPVTIVEFADFECPACRSAYSALERAVEEYSDRVRFVFRDFPLPMHARAVPASEAALCARAQGKFWDYHQNLMIMDGTLDDADLMKRAQDLGLDAEQFKNCFESRRFAPEVQASFQQGRELAVDSTPTLFINGRRLVGVQGYEALREIIEEELDRAS